MELPYPASVCIILAIVVGYISVLLFNFLTDPLLSVPGPFLARFTRLWELFAARRGHFEQVNVELHERYGPVVRIAPGRYSISDVQAFKDVYSHGSKFIKSPFYSAFGDTNPHTRDLFSVRDTKSHSEKRKAVASLYSMTTLLNYEPFVDSCTAELCEKLTTFASEARSICIPDWMQYYAFDVIGEITTDVDKVGRSFDYMKSESDPTAILKSVHESLTYGSLVGLLPELHPWIAFISRTLKLRLPSDSILEFVLNRINGRKQGKETSLRLDFLTTLLSLREKEKLSDVDVITTVAANIAAGSDTTAISLSSIIYYLFKNPAATEKLKAEIDDFERAGKISDPVTFREAQEMPYLQAVIKEALRIHPATGQPLARIVPPGGVELCGRFFPAGTVVGSNPWVTHRDESIFGTAPDTFRPERWLEDKEDVLLRDRNLFAFGAGSRTCIGKNISMLEMTKVIPQIYRNFDIKLDDSAKQWKLETFWFVKQKFNCTVELREKS